MSRYSMAIISESVSPETLNTIGRKYNLMFTLIKNLYVKNQLEKNKQLYLIQWINQDFCSFVGDFKTTKLSPEKCNEINMLMPLEFRDSFDELQNYVQSLFEETKQEVEQSVINWRGFLKEFLTLCISEMGLLLHWYATEIEKEKIRIKEKREMLVGEEPQDCLHMPLEDDVLYVIRRQ